MKLIVFKIRYFEIESYFGYCQSYKNIKSFKENKMQSVKESQKNLNLLF